MQGSSPSSVRANLCSEYMICNYYDPEFEVGFQVIDCARYIISNDNGRTLTTDGTADADCTKPSL